MKPPSIPLASIKALPIVYRVPVSSTYEDENGHMNMRYYLAIYDDAGYPLFQGFGLDTAYHQSHNTGGFDLEHHIHYLNEVGIGDELAVYARLVSRTAKRLHYLLFMVNDTRDNLASIYECVNSFADLSVRRTAPYPDMAAARMDAMLQQHQALDWPAPVCGVMSA